MKNELACLLAMLFAFAQPSSQFREALPGYKYEFPRDHFNHPDFQTEWWYYTGNVQATDGHRFGFELTFFRQALDRAQAGASLWDIRDLYIAHFALSDLDGGRFYHAERINRPGPGIAGVSQSDGRIWNGNWQVRLSDDEQLDAIDERFSLHFHLHPSKPSVVNGENGVSQKADGAGRASHYISLTRLIASGQIELGLSKFEVSGLAWMDHEFFTAQLSSDQIGWDWVSIQLNDDTELMLFRLRRRDRSLDPHSSGTFVDASGQSSRLSQSEFQLEPAEETWTSSLTHGVYPVHWRLTIPKFKARLDISTPLPAQEVVGENHLLPAYWEGAMRISGKKETTPVAGVGYLEMTGYDQPFRSSP